MSHRFRASKLSDAGSKSSSRSTFSYHPPPSTVASTFAAVRSLATRIPTTDNLQKITVLPQLPGNAMLKYIAVTSLAVLFNAGIAQATDAISEVPIDQTIDQTPRVEMVTSEGSIVLELDRQRAPRSVENFLEYVNSGFYDGTIFHRVIESFMIQGGGFTASYAKKTTKSPIKNEANNGLKNLHYTIAMARTNAPHSATAQFFINSTDQNNFLDHTAATQRGWGYAVFGRVIDGKDVVDRISRTPTGAGGPFSRDVPVKTVTINSARQILPQTAEAQGGGSATSATADSTIAVDATKTSKATPVKTE